MVNLFKIAKTGGWDKVSNKSKTTKSALLINEKGENLVAIAAYSGTLERMPKNMITLKTLTVKDDADMDAIDHLILKENISVLSFDLWEEIIKKDPTVVAVMTIKGIVENLN